MMKFLAFYLLTVAASAADTKLIECGGETIGPRGQSRLTVLQDSQHKVYAVFQRDNSTPPQIIAKDLECTPVDKRYPFVFNCYGPNSNSLHGNQLIKSNNYSSSLKSIDVRFTKYIEIDQTKKRIDEVTDKFRTFYSNCKSYR